MLICSRGVNSLKTSSNVALEIDGIISMT